MMVLLLSSKIDNSIEFNFTPTIENLVDTYLNRDTLTDLLQDLPRQFSHPQPRKWALIDWRRIDTSQIVGIEPQLFLAIIKGSIDIPKLADNISPPYIPKWPNLLVGSSLKQVSYKPEVCGN
jgi:hypothetical protein